MWDAGDVKHQGAENSALKNNAPLSLTPLRISEKHPFDPLNGLQNLPAGLQSHQPRRTSEQFIGTLGHGCRPQFTPQL